MDNDFASVNEGGIRGGAIDIDFIAGQDIIVLMPFDLTAVALKLP